MRAEPWMNGEEHYRETMRAQVMAAPRVVFVCERDWQRGPHVFAIGVLWDRNFDAEPGELIYRRRIVLRWCIQFWGEWQVRRPKQSQ